MRLFTIVGVMGLGAVFGGCFVALVTWSVAPLAVAGLGAFMFFCAWGAAQDAWDRGDAP